MACNLSPIPCPLSPIPCNLSTTMTEASQPEGLQRRLSPRQLTMMAIGGAIGVGLFLGSSVTIELAGPAVILSYVLGAGVAVVVAYALAEMAVVHPVAGSFGVYAERYLNAWTGFAVRAIYALAQILAIGAEVTAVAIYFAFWFPHTPPWLWVSLVSLALMAVNALQVGRFGEFEYWFALIKVVAILMFIGVGMALISGLGPGPAIGFSNLTAHGGFLPHGWRGVWLALTLVITSYMGVELIAVTAGEARRPEVSIPRAVRGVVFRLILFYILTMIVVLAMTPWNQTSGGGTLSGSPFVRVFSALGVRWAASIMNLVVISAALSSANTNLYLSTRMLFSLARGQYAPPWLGKVSRNGVPRMALAVSSAGMAAAILLAIYAPKQAFLQLYGAAVGGMFFIWIVILLTHLRFRRALGPERVARLPMRLPWHPAPSLLGIVAVTAIALTTFFVPGLEYSLPALAVLLALMAAAYWVAQRAKATRKPRSRNDCNGS